MSTVRSVTVVFHPPIDPVSSNLPKTEFIESAKLAQHRHSAEMIKKLEQAGLGYHIESGETTDKLGKKHNYLQRLLFPE